MSQQIRALANKAGYDDLFYEIAKEGLDKFAGLIILECIDAVEQADTTHAHTTFDKDFVDGTIEKCVQSIKERFEL